MVALSRTCRRCARPRAVAISISRTVAYVDLGPAADLLPLRCGLIDLDLQSTRLVSIFCPPRLVLLHIEFNQPILSGIDIISTKDNTFKRTIPGFVGIKLLGTGAVDNNHSGPDGVTSHGRWLYAGDGDSTLKVIDLNAPTASAIKQSIPSNPG